MKFYVRVRPGTGYVLKIEKMDRDLNMNEFRDDAERLLAWMYAGLPSATLEYLLDLVYVDQDQRQIAYQEAEKVIKTMESKQAERK